MFNPYKNAFLIVFFTGWRPVINRLWWWCDIATRKTFAARSRSSDNPSDVSPRDPAFEPVSDSDKRYSEYSASWGIQHAMACVCHFSTWYPLGPVHVCYCLFQELLAIQGMNPARFVLQDYSYSFWNRAAGERPALFGQHLQRLTASLSTTIEVSNDTQTKCSNPRCATTIPRILSHWISERGFPVGVYDTAQSGCMRYVYGDITTNQWIDTIHWTSGRFV